MKKRITLEIISFLFVLLFMYAALNKIFDYEKFAVQIGQSPLLTGFGDSLPWLVITIEIMTSICFVIPRFRLIGLLSAFSLMTMFSIYIIAILNFSDYVPCSCGGVLEKLGWTEHLIFNLGFVVLSLIGIVLHTKEELSARGGALNAL
jgi:uncharacterized membrane protein YphA (DoxX/SURF4 family)